MEGTLQRDEFLFLGELFGKAHGSFVGLGATAPEEALLQSPRRDLGQFLREVGHSGDVIDVRTAVDQLVHLGLGGLQHGWVAMPRIHHGDAREEVGVSLPILVRDLGTLRLNHNHGLHCLHEGGVHIFSVFLLGVHGFNLREERPFGMLFSAAASDKTVQSGKGF